MKITIEQAEFAFQRVLRALQHEVWGRLDGIVLPRHLPFQEMNPERLDLEFDLNDEIAEDQVKLRTSDLESKLGFAAQSLAQLPGTLVARACLGCNAREVKVPAGCDPLDPVEIRSAIKRACLEIADGPLDCVLLVPSGSQEFFLAAQDSNVPPEIQGANVRIQPTGELLDRAVLAELFPETGDGAGTDNGLPGDYASKMVQALRRTPWFVLGRGRAPFEYRWKVAPHLTSVNGSLFVEWSAELAYNPEVPIVKVSASRLALASRMPTQNLVTA